ncbi:MAG: hypothetical protein A2583_09660 [Bdellovibrionales bacterium RIFOXYD1_FULL_53_11]|nr:MAG: hypothetical protein A2583_09660 [Bdellovibrionales bacterium RIFOXYD1_FULL_53_11]
MIKINLATMKQAASAGGAGDAPVKRGDIIGTISQALTGLIKRRGVGAAEGGGIDKKMIRKIILMIGVGFAADFLAGDFMAEEMKKVEAALARVDAEKSKFQAEVQKTRGYEAIKKQLEADEFIIRTKVDTMEKLVTDRQTPPKLLLSVATAIPKDVWLSSFKVDGPSVVFSGGSVGFNPVSDFMKTLGESAYFSELNLQKTEQTRDAAGTEIAIFELMARRKGEMFK